MPGKTIWTIGHSTRSADEFISILRSFNIQLLADVRLYPSSARFPHFNKEKLATLLLKNNIEYLHLKDLGGRRKPKKDSVNTAWHNVSFRGYADYMETETFKKAIEQLTQAAQKMPTAYMCAEALWWSCHRALISDHLKLKGWKVMHILKEGKSQEHPYTKAASIIDGKLNYTEPDLFT